jgi:AcrR family transcriptional regulator
MDEVGERAEKSAEKILSGTMKALSRQGARKLSVSDICEASGVARGTFYRYFTSKDDVLATLARHDQDGVAEAFVKAIEINPDPKVRVQVVLDTITDYRLAGADLVRMLDVAPEFTLGFIRETFPNVVGAVTVALGPAIEESPVVVSGALTQHQLADLLMRSVISTLLFPGGRSDKVAAMVASLFSIDTGATAGKTKRKHRGGGRN